MTREDLKHIIHFAEMNGMMDWTFEDALNEYLTTKETAEDIETAIDNYEFYLSTGGQFHSPEEFIACLEETDECLITKITCKKLNYYHTPWGEKDRSKCYKYIYLPKGGKKQKKQRLW